MAHRESGTAPGETDADPDTDDTDPRHLMYGKNLLGFHGRLSAAEQVAEVEVRGWDTETKQSSCRPHPPRPSRPRSSWPTRPSMAGFFGDQTFIAGEPAGHR